MDIVKIIGIGLVGAVSSMVVKEYKPPLAAAIAIITAVILFACVISGLSYIIDVIEIISAHIGISGEYISVIMKMIGIAYLAEFGAQVCKDAGEGAVAKKIELAGKVIIVSMSLPVLIALMNLLVSMI